jgi:hypothetical protein
LVHQLVLLFRITQCTDMVHIELAFSFLSYPIRIKVYDLYLNSAVFKWFCETACSDEVHGLINYFIEEVS